MGSRIRNELSRQSPWPLEFENNPSSRLRVATTLVEGKLLSTSGRCTPNDARFDRRYWRAGGSLRPTT